MTLPLITPVKGKLSEYEKGDLINVLYFKGDRENFQIPNNKYQNSNKSQIPSTKYQTNLKYQISNKSQITN